MSSQSSEKRQLVGAEKRTPSLLHNFILQLEETKASSEVWRLIVSMGEEVGLPCIDFICASSIENWKRTHFIRTSYDSGWLNEINKDPDISNWSYFRSHAIHHLTPIAIGIEYLDESKSIPMKRVEVLKESARRGMRAGFSVPLRYTAPPQAALISFMGDLSRAECDEVIARHGWTLNVAAMMAHQRYMTHFASEFTERNKISVKQRELLEMVGHGLQDKQIAGILDVSISAVRQRMNHLMKKTGMTNRAELAALAMSMGILPDPVHRPDRPERDILIDMGI